MSAGFLAAFLLAAGISLTLMTGLDEGLRSSAPGFLAGGVVSLIWMVHLALRRRPVRRREMLSDISGGSLVDLGHSPWDSSDSEPSSDEYRRL